MDHMARLGVALALSLAVAGRVAAGEADGEQPLLTAPGSYAGQIDADKPIAYWRLDESSGTTAANSAGSLGQGNRAEGLSPEAAAHAPLAGKIVAGVRLGLPGPRPERFPDFSSANLAASFDGQGAYVKVADPGEASPLDFTLGDSITLEAWVSLNRIEEGQQIYVVGKGRTNNPGLPRDNQNYALRLRAAPDAGTNTAAISFLFRSADATSAGDPAIPHPAAAQPPSQGGRGFAEQPINAAGNWHRWTSHAGFVEGSGWHHIAVSYTFGQPESIRGYIDGLEVDGAWDMGGPTKAAPVVDDDELWIGSSMGGNPGSSFNGLIDEVALYRTALSSEQLARHYRAAVPERKQRLAQVKPGEVLIEILEGVPDKQSWEFPEPQLTEQYVERAFGLVAVPKKYSEKAIVLDRSSPFLVRATGEIELPRGKYRLLLRSRGAARLYLDDRLVAELAFPSPNSDGHEPVPELKPAVEPGLRPVQVGDYEKLVSVTLDGAAHEFRLESLVGGRRLRPELGELSVSIAGEGESFRLLSQSLDVPLSDEGWTAYAADQLARLEEFNRRLRAQNGAGEAEYWARRHELARQHWQQRKRPEVPEPSDPAHTHNAVDQFVNARLAEAGLRPAELVDDAAFLRRVTLDTVGVIPTVAEIEAFLADSPGQRRAKAIDRLLEDPRWADHWVSYWQDVLAENPGILKPQLNNTGPFRYWIYESLVDNKPADRFATELVMMEGSRLGGGPAGFSMATQNDSPMAAKAHVLAKAFLGVELQCARCHDAPYHPFKQLDTFSLAALLNRAPLKVPDTSTIPAAEAARRPLVEVTLPAGATVEPKWPFEELLGAELPDGLLRDPDDPRERFAALLTSPANERFAQVMVNRLWHRLLGRGLVEPVDDWHDAKPSHPELLDYLARELATHDYDLKHLARLILNSHTYQRAVQPPEAGTQTAGPAAGDSSAWHRLFGSPPRRRLSAEQLVDSLFLAVDKPLGCEELTLDPDGRRPLADFLNLGVPRRAWQFASLSNERDRPALALPVAQSILDVLQAFGWRESRANPITERETEPTVLQPLVVANGTMASRITRLSDDSAVTRLCLEEQPVERLVERVFWQVLTRPPDSQEQELFAELLREGYAERVVAASSRSGQPATRRTAVSWSNHLSPEATRIKLELERAARAGDPPTERLRPDWRERMEDFVWALVNTPEFAFVP